MNLFLLEKKKSEPSSYFYLLWFSGENGFPVKSHYITAADSLTNSTSQED